MGITDAKRLLIIGSFWFFLTIAFEFIFGYYVVGNNWDKLLMDYNVLKGRLWILVLINNITAPLISRKLIRN
jgi:hypothetical protein